MLYLDTWLRAGMAILFITGMGGGATACAFMPTPEQRSAEVQQMTERETPYLVGCSEVTIRTEQLSTMGANGAFAEQIDRAVVAYTHIGAGSHIGMTGDSSCLWIKGNVGPNVAISVSGAGSGVIIEGTVDPSARIDVGPASLTWIPKLQSLGIDRPDLRISSENGGRLVINGNTMIEP